jgi:hypothetical protein
VALFSHLTPKTLLSRDVRETSAAQIGIAFRHHGVYSVDPDMLENIIFQRANVSSFSYLQTCFKRFTVLRNRPQSSRFFSS